MLDVFIYVPINHVKEWPKQIKEWLDSKGSLVLFYWCCRMMALIHVYRYCLFREGTEEKTSGVLLKESRRPPEYKIAEKWGTLNYFYKLCVFTISTGHEAVRLPVAYCELNLIKMAWSQMKGYVC